MSCMQKKIFFIFKNTKHVHFLSAIQRRDVFWDILYAKIGEHYPVASAVYGPSFQVPLLSWPPDLASGKGTEGPPLASSGNTPPGPPLAAGKIPPDRHVSDV